MISEDDNALNLEAFEEVEPTDPRVCPFCGHLEGCRHLLLDADLMFGMWTAEGGELQDEFNDRLSEITEKSRSDFDRTTAFLELLKEVESLADSSTGYTIERGPGLSSSSKLYWSSSGENLDEVRWRFIRAETAGST